MATTAVTINIDSAVIPEVVRCLCIAGGYPESEPNAKQAVNWIRQTVLNVETAELTPPTPPSPLDPSLLT